MSASCLAGTWTLDSEAFLRASYGRFTTDGTEPAFGDFTGDFEVTFSSDGGFHGVRHAWSWAIGTAQGMLRTTLDGDDDGTWTLSGDGLTMDKQSDGVTGTVKLEVDGQRVDVPVPPSSDIDTDLLNGTVAADCQGDTLTLTKEVPAVFTRTTASGG